MYINITECVCMMNLSTPLCNVPFLHLHLISFVSPIDLEEDEAIEEAIRRSLDESVNYSHDLRYNICRLISICLSVCLSPHVESWIVLFLLSFSKSNILKGRLTRHFYLPIYIFTHAQITHPEGCWHVNPWGMAKVKVKTKNKIYHLWTNFIFSD